jgi:hypothetical protein
MTATPATTAGPPERRPESRALAFAGAAKRSFEALTRDQAQAILQTRPDPVAAIRRPGRDPYRVLLFGGGVLTGAGLHDHDRGLPGRIADEIARRRSRGVSLDVVVEPHPTAPAALVGFAGMRLRRYDAVIVVLAEQDAGQIVDVRWRGAVVGLTKLLLTETSASAGLFLYDSTKAVAPALPIAPSPRSVSAADRLIAIDEEVSALTRRVRFAEIQPSVLPADPVRGFADGTYRDWAAWMVDRLEPALRTVDQTVDEDSPRRFRDRPQLEKLRQRAVDSLRLRPGERDEDLDFEVRQAKLMFRATLAALTIVDRASVWTRATTGSQDMLADRTATPCDIGVRSDGLLLIEDLWQDPRTRDNPALRGPQPLRFYAGYPVRTWDGYRIGMLCVFGDAPRSPHHQELDALRDVAGRVEGMLWRKALRPAAR